jgi:hypothetical protein
MRIAPHLLLPSFIYGCTGSIQAQHGVGLCFGRDLIFPSEQAKVSDLSAFSIGLLCTDLAGERSSWRGTLVWASSSFHQEGYLEQERWAEWDILTDDLQLTFAGRIALSPRNIVSFDIEPVIGYRVAQRFDGVSYYRGYNSADTVHYISHRSVDRSFCEARLRIGVSADLPIAKETWLMAGVHMGWGGSQWPIGSTYTSWDHQFRIGVERMIGH